MKHNHHLTIAAVLLVGCGNPDDALNQAAFDGNIEAVKKHLASGANVDAKDNRLRKTPLNMAIGMDRTEAADPLQTRSQDG